MLLSDSLEQVRIEDGTLKDGRCTLYVDISFQDKESQLLLNTSSCCCYYVLRSYLRLNAFNVA